MTAATGEGGRRGWSTFGFFLSNFDGVTVGLGFLAPVVRHFFFPVFVGAGVDMGFFFSDFDGIIIGLAFLAPELTRFFLFLLLEPLWISCESTKLAGYDYVTMMLLYFCRVVRVIVCS